MDSRPAPSGSQRDDDARWGALLNWREHKLPPGVPVISGCDIQESARHQRAAFMLRRLILHGERGIPAFAHEDVIEPVWIEGETVRVGGRHLSA